MASLMVWPFFGRPSYSAKPPQDFPKDDLITASASVISERLINPDSGKLNPKIMQAVKILMMSWVETNDAHITEKRAKPVMGRAKRIPCQIKDRVSLKKNKTPVQATV